jgi:hypothetical protein
MKRERLIAAKNEQAVHVHFSTLHSRCLGDMPATNGKADLSAGQATLLNDSLIHL